MSALAPRGGCLLGDGLQAAAALLLSSPLSPSLLRERRSALPTWCLPGGSQFVCPVSPFF